MSMFIPAQSIMGFLTVSLCTLPFRIGNLFSYVIRPFKFYRYNKIEKIQYYSYDILDEFCEEMAITYNPELVDKYTKLISKEEFLEVMKKLKKYRIFGWKRWYLANYEYYDGGEWNFKATMKSGRSFKVDGDVCGPRKLEDVVELIKEFFGEDEWHHNMYE